MPACISVIGDDVKEGDIRLIPDSYLWQGLVEIFLDGVWGRIHDGGADYIDAKVVCRQLGYNTYSKSFALQYFHFYPLYYTSFFSTDARESSNYEQFGEINDLFHLTNLMCSGSEYRLTDCQYDDSTDIMYHFYSISDEWIVYCPEG